MKIVRVVLSALGLLLTIVPSFLLLCGSIESGMMTKLMISGMVLWVIGRTLPHKPKDKIDHEGVI